MPKFIAANRDQPFLLPPDLRDWVPEGDLAHFVVEAVDRVPMESFVVNERGTGSAQYPPRLMLALLVYCYANGIFGSRRIERATYRDVGVRYVAANLHPDHDTICSFRRNNVSAIASAFEQVLLMARELKLLRVGTVSVDGTKVDANASKRKGLRYDRAKELREQLQREIAGFVEEAERADGEEGADEQSLPPELQQRKQLKEKLDAACATLERRARRRAERERVDHERRLAEREKLPPNRRGRKPKPPSEEPEAKQQINLVDQDSGLMKKSPRGEYRQAYNAQAVVDADGSQLVLGARVSVCANDRQELVADVDSVPEAVGNVERVLADNGFAAGSEVKALEDRGIDVLVSTGGGDHRRRHDFRPETRKKPRKEPKSEWVRKMQEKLARDDNRRRYSLRKQTVEPVFGIVKHVLGFRQFHLRGKPKVETEWKLVMLAYNCKRLHRLMAA